MGILTEDMQRVVREQKLGYAATVCPDGTPNLSPKGTTTVWDDDHLVFAAIRSPNTVRNLRQNPAIEINVVDPLLRKGYRFKGTAQILTEGPLFEEILSSYRRDGLAVEWQGTKRVKAIVLVNVRRALALTSPAYDLGLTEAEVAARWEQYWEELRESRCLTVEEPQSAR